MLSLVLILLGGGAVLVACYAMGLLPFPSLRLPHVARFAVGAAIVSHAVFLLLAAGLARERYVLALITLPLAVFVFRWPDWRRPAFGKLFDSWATRLMAATGAIIGAFYFIHALAPEIEPDAMTYHLGLVREWLNRDGFSGSVGFYELIPQGLEMLFVPAYAIGKHSAAKLVHFAFLVATVPLLLETASRLGLDRWKAGAAALLYCCTPIVGLTGTSAYNDTALVFFLLATFHLLLLWEQEDDWRYVALAGITAGFCYSIKMTGAVAPLLAVGFLLLRRRLRLAMLLAAGAALMVCPWLIRNAVWTGNPFAPLLNAVFENRYFHILTERELAAGLQNYGGVTWLQLPAELTIHGFLLQGLIGPVFLLSPLALLALRRPAGRVALLLAALVAIPWFVNHGARFLLPSLLFLALALAIALPRAVVVSLALVHAFLSLPPMLALYAHPEAARLEGWPVRAALRLEPEEEYLRRERPDTVLAGLLQQHVPPSSPVLDLYGAPEAYCDAVAIRPWQSASADRMSAALDLAANTGAGAFTDQHALWPARPLTALRLRLAGTGGPRWSVQELRLRRQGRTIARQPEWTVSSWPNVWESPLALDGNLATGWAPWEALRAGMYLQLNFTRPIVIDGATALVPTPNAQPDVEFLGREPDGKWIRLAETPGAAPQPATDIRRSAIQLLKREGVGFILAPVEHSVFSPLGTDLLRNQGEWGIEIAGSERGIYLFRIQ